MAKRRETLCEADYEMIKRFVQVELLDYVPMPRTIDAAKAVERVIRLYLEGERTGTFRALIDPAS